MSTRGGSQAAGGSQVAMRTLKSKIPQAVLEEQAKPTVPQALTDDRNFACPFLKRDPLTYRSCASLSLKVIKQVKQHLRRRHYVAYYCPRCMIPFDTEVDKNQHLRVDPPCPISEGIGTITVDMESALHKRTDSRLPSTEQWYSIWDIIFPGNAKPISPYIPTDSSEELVLFHEYLLAKGPAHLSSTLNQQQTQTLKDPQFLNKLLSRSLECIFDSGTQWLRHGNTVASNSEAVGPINTATTPSGRNVRDDLDTEMTQPAELASSDSVSRPSLPAHNSDPSSSAEVLVEATAADHGSSAHPELPTSGHQLTAPLNDVADTVNTAGMGVDETSNSGSSIRLFSKPETSQSRSKPYSCEKGCSDFKSHTLRDLERHYISRHNKHAPKYICKCGIGMTRRDNYMRHIARCRKPRPSFDFRCQCGEETEKLDAHQEHLLNCGRQKRGRPVKQLHAVSNQ